MIDPYSGGVPRPSIEILRAEEYLPPRIYGGITASGSQSPSNDGIYGRGEFVEALSHDDFARMREVAYRDRLDSSPLDDGRTRGVPDGMGFAAQSFQGNGISNADSGKELNTHPTDPHSEAEANPGNENLDLKDTEGVTLRGDLVANARIAGIIVGGQIREKGGNAVYRLLSRRNRTEKEVPSAGEVTAIIALASVVSVVDKADRIIRGEKK